MGKIAAELERALARRKRDGGRGGTTPRVLARGNGWTVADVVCTSGPGDASFEEEHSHHTIAIVLAGTFHYRSAVGGGLMTPGSVMLGTRGLCYECGHQHGEGDRCVSFWYAPDYFERLAADCGARTPAFSVASLPPMRALSPMVTRAALGVVDDAAGSWEELAIRLAAGVLRLNAAPKGDPLPPPNAEARVTRTVRMIEAHPDATLTLDRLAQAAGLSPYYFLRTFERLTGVTPHQHILRTRLREAAIRLVAEAGTVLDIALECGFGDVSNFNRAFRTEFGVSPRRYREDVAASRAGV